jgi:hypothetical protein
VFEAQGVRVVRTPVHTPEANGIAERFVRTVRSECLDWLLMLNARHLEHTLKVFVDHYNSGRPHRSLGLVPPNRRPPVKPKAVGDTIHVRRRDRLADCCTSTSARRERDPICAPYRVETLVRALVDHLAAFGGIPLVTVFDRPKTIALRWGRLFSGRPASRLRLFSVRSARVAVRSISL